MLMARAFGLIILIHKRFRTKRYPLKVKEILDSVPDLEQVGLKKYESGYAGYYMDYDASIYATTSIKN